MPPPLLTLTAAYLVGIVAGHIARPAPAVALAVGGVTLLLAVFARRRPGAVRALVLATALSAGTLAAGAAWAALEPVADSRWTVLEGRVVSDPRPTATGWRFVVRASAAGHSWRAGERVWVTCPDGGDRPVEADDLVRVEGFLTAPGPASNPGQPDFALYLASAGIRHVLRARVPPEVLARASPGAPAALCRRLRDRVLAYLDRALPPSEAGLLAGLLFGDTDRLDEDLAADFRRAGVYHILAVSGSNVAFVAWGFWLVCRPALRLAGLRGPRAERAAWPLTAVVLVGYAVMCGLGPAVTRATLMAEAGLVYLWLGRRRDPRGPLALAALVMLVPRPLLILDVGFVLSFAATLGLLTVYPVVRDRVGRPLLSRLGPTWRRPAAPVLEATLVSAAAQAAVMPVLATQFGEVSLAGLLANAAVVPLSGLAVTAGLGAGVLGLAGAVGAWAAKPLAFVTWLLLRAATVATRAFASLPLATVVTGAPPAWAVALYYPALAWVVAGARAGKAARRMLAALALALTLVALCAVAPQPAEVTFLDVGQGDAAVVRLPGGRLLLIDGGPAGAGKGVVAPFLRHRGWGRVDVVFVSHLHDDHAGALLELLGDRGLAFGELVLARRPPDEKAVGASPDSPSPEPPPLLEALLGVAAARRIPVTWVGAGDALTAADGSWLVEVLGPESSASSSGKSEPACGLGGGRKDPGSDRTGPGSNRSGHRGDPENDRSLVLLITVPGARFVFPGDLEASGEAALLASGRLGRPPSGREVGQTTLKVPHHGSASSSTEAFLEAVGPDVAVVSVGPNVFGHPSPATLARLEVVAGAVLVTREDGAVTVRVTRRGLEVEGFLSGRRTVPGGG
ncbi:MAG: ComEC/Rec2 family competence protein [Firmicutes bacterium]|nr:ComEC/Rec2 family competence protein [Bacillota bacterium]